MSDHKDSEVCQDFFFFFSKLTHLLKLFGVCLNISTIKFSIDLFQEPSNKRVKPVAKSNSLTGVITPVKTPALKRIGQSISVTKPLFVPQNDHLSLILHACAQCLISLQRSISFRTDARPLPPAPLRSRTKASSFPRRRNSQCWSDTVESHDLTAKEIKRQEVWILIQEPLALFFFFTLFGRWG